MHLDKQLLKSLINNKIVLTKLILKRGKASLANYNYFCVA